MELWGGKDEDGATEFQKKLNAYKQVLSHLHELKVTTAGYVDKPSADLVTRLLEVAMTPQPELAGMRDRHPLRGVADLSLYSRLLAPGERSAVFAMQSQSAKNYPGPLALHFFYLNVGRAGRPWISRVEIPAWVAESPGCWRICTPCWSAVPLDSNDPTLSAAPRPRDRSRRQQEKSRVTQMIG
jgi:hypothetical protein